MKEERLTNRRVIKNTDMEVRKLTKGLNNVIKSSNATYEVVIKALKWLQIAYQDKGDNFLADISIKDIAGVNQRLSVTLPKEED